MLDQLALRTCAFDDLQAFARNHPAFQLLDGDRRVLVRRA
jgi:hypothetical protein